INKGNKIESAEDFILNNKNFHEELNKISGNEMLTDMISKLRNNVSRYLNVYVLSNSTYNKIRQGNKDHQSILMAIKEKERDKEEKLIREHIKKTCKSIIEYLENRNIKM